MMTRMDLTNNFVTNLETERYRLELTQAQMAQKLGMGISTYKKLVLGGTQRIDLYTAYLLHRITGDTLLKLVGYPEGIGEIVSELRTLSAAQLRVLQKSIAIEKEFLRKHPGLDAEDFVPLLMPVRDQAWIQRMASAGKRQGEE